MAAGISASMSWGTSTRPRSTAVLSGQFSHAALTSALLFFLRREQLLELAGRDDRDAFVGPEGQEVGVA